MDVATTEPKFDVVGDTSAKPCQIRD